MIGRILKIAVFCVVFAILAGISAYFTLSLVIKSEDTVIVPDFIGKDVVYVLEYLTELGLNTNSLDIPKHHVIYQEPEPGIEIKKGRDVKIIISKGTQTILMPNLSGLPLRQARIIFEENDLCRGQVSNTYNLSLQKDAIIAQVPAAGMQIHRGDCIDLLVSLGQRPSAYKMPYLIGLPLEDALVMIEKSDLIHGDIQTLYSADKPRRSVIKQEPAGGYRVLEQSPVNIVVNRKKPEKSEGGLGTVQKGSLFRYRIDNGFLKRHIRIQLKRTGFTSDLFDDFVRPGEEIWLIIPTDEEALVLLYEDEKLIRTMVYAAW
jgi:serine/threonine-protein kinase